MSWKIIAEWFLLQLFKTQFIPEGWLQVEEAETAEEEEINVNMQLRIHTKDLREKFKSWAQQVRGSPEISSNYIFNISPMPTFTPCSHDVNVGALLRIPPWTVFPLPYFFFWPAHSRDNEEQTLKCVLWYCINIRNKLDKHLLGYISEICRIKPILISQPHKSNTSLHSGSYSSYQLFISLQL